LLLSAVFSVPSGICNSPFLQHRGALAVGDHQDLDLLLVRAEEMLALVRIRGDERGQQLLRGIKFVGSGNEPVRIDLRDPLEPAAVDLVDDLAVPDVRGVDRRKQLLRDRRPRAERHYGRNDTQRHPSPPGNPHGPLPVFQCSVLAPGSARKIGDRVGVAIGRAAAAPPATCHALNPSSTLTTFVPIWSVA
jgi:hypothetical protein